MFGKLQGKWLDDNGALQMETGDIVKNLDYSGTNVESALEGIDAVIFFGGSDISPSLYRNPQKVANKGEGFNATRDVSDYILMSYCLGHDIPMLCICRGMQMLGVVSGCEFAQDIPEYYASLGLKDNQYHRVVDGNHMNFAYHDIRITDRNSLIYKIVAADALDRVSSWHHQAITSTEGTDLTVTATADLAA